MRNIINSPNKSFHLTTTRQVNSSVSAAYREDIGIDFPSNDINNGLLTFQSDPENKNTVEVAAQLGNILKIQGMPIVQKLTPRNSDGLEKSNYSGNYGMNEFPLHTDLAHWYIPPRYFLLRCVVPSQEVITTFVPAAKVFFHEEDIELKRALFRPRRRLDGRLSVLNLWQNDLYRRDTLYLKPMTHTAKQLQAIIENKLKNIKPVSVVLSKRGSCVLVDNWKILHGRSSVPPTSQNRLIERVYISELRVKE